MRRKIERASGVLRGLAAFALLAAGSGVAVAQTNSLSFDAGNRHVTISAATSGAIHLHVTAATEPSTRKTIFLAPGVDDGSVPCQVAQNGNTIDAKFAGGELMVDSAAGSFTLQDAHGKTLIANSLLPTAGVTQSTGLTHMECVLTQPQGGNATLYGSGDQTNGLEQGNRSNSRVGNGVTSVPFYWSANGYAVLILGEDDNSPASWTRNAGQNPLWTIPGPTADLYLMPATNLTEAEERYAELTGKAPVPPRWAFGYLQSRWGWVDPAYIDDTLKHFVDDKLPVDGFIFDFEWFTPTADYSLPPEGTDTYRDFIWNPKLFPDPAKQVAALHAAGVHFIGIRKPRLGNSDSLADAHAKGWILHGATRGQDARALDYSNPAVRDWYAAQLEPMLKVGIDGWWNDEGEATFTSYTYWGESEQEALDAVNPTGRLWTIDRAFQPGLQRHSAAAWTGDIASTFPSLQNTPTKLLNWTLAGMPYVGCDIGGFMGQDTPELLTRWDEAGVFFPVMRAHSTNRVQPRFPWLYGPEAEANIKKALELRYRLIPMYYSLAHETYETGVSLMRPLVMVFPNDPAAANISNQWMVGDSVMAAPILTAAAADAKTTDRTVYLPDGVWYALDSNKPITGAQTMSVTVGMDSVPTYVRAGSILTLGPIIQHTDQLPGGPLQLQVYPGKDATATLVEDDGNTTAYQQGQIRRTTFTWNDASRTLTWKIDGPYAGKDIFTAMDISVMDPGTVATASSPLTASGQAQVAKK